MVEILSFKSQEDGATCAQIAKTTKISFGDHNINVPSWPSNSPDLN